MTPTTPSCTIADERSSYFSSRDSTRSASGLPPVWQVGQYWNVESLKITCRTVSPHTGQGTPLRPCTRRSDFFSRLQLARRDAVGARDRVPQGRLRSRRRASRRPRRGMSAGLNGDIFATCRISSE